MSRLPMLARAFLRLVDPNVREFVSGDLQESFDRLSASDGVTSARGWCVKQALGAAVTNPWRPRQRLAMRGDGVIRTLLQDLRYGARMARRQPSFAFVVVLTLALAIGANTVIFSFANVLLLRPLPIRESDRIGWIFTMDPQRGTNRGGLSIPEFLDYRAGLTTFEGIVGTTRGSAVLTGRGDAERVDVSYATANVIDVWGLRMQRGRTFSRDADRPGMPREIVLSDRYWTTHLARDPAVVGTTMTIDGRPATVVGVLAPDIEIGNLSSIDMWIPLELSPTASRLERSVRVTARLKPGVTIAQADEEVRRLAQRLAIEQSASNAGWSARVATTHEAITGPDTWAVLALLVTVVGLVLLIACANLANLVLSASATRRRELAVRSALGASRMRVIRQLLTENFIYGIAGGAAGLLVAYFGLNLVKAVSFDPFFRWVSIDRNVLLFTMGLAIVTPMLFSLLPALHSSRADVNEALKDNGTRSTGGQHVGRSRSVLVVAQLGLAVALLVLATLLVQALRNIANAPLGFDPRPVLTGEIELPRWQFAESPAISTFYEQLLVRLQSTPGIEGAALTNRIPLLGSESSGEVAIEGRPSTRPEDRPWAVPAVVSDTYFSTLGISRVAGRTFSTADAPDRAPAAVVNKEMARRHWGTPEAALGARVSLASDTGDRRWAQIVGVVSDVLRGDREAVNPEIYLSARQRPQRAMTLAIRTADPGSVAPVVRGLVRSADPDVPLTLRPLQDALDEDLSASRVLGGLFVAFALLALVLAASGLYAVVSYSAAQRVKEIGVRVALGAMPGDITRLMLGQAAIRVAIGAAIGVAGGRVLALGASTLLYRVSPSDPRTYVGVTLTLAAIALVASYVPVRRATRVDPLTALRLD